MRAAVSPATKIFRCVIMGPPGSGKGTVSERIVNNFHIHHVPCGDFLRHEIKNGTQKGKLAKQFIDKGELVPDDLVGEIIVSELEKHKETANLLLDGFPRTVTQAKLLEEKIPINCVLELDVPFPVIIDRLKSRWIHPGSGRIYNLGFNPPKVLGKDDLTGEDLVQRDDDKPETVSKRLENYKLWEEPVANYFKQLQLLVRFSGKATNEIWPHILQYLKTHMPLKEHHHTHHHHHFHQTPS